jgi:tetratricopeptide (TPR) repeat protein/DNA-binding SARP family transcriptional activator
VLAALLIQPGKLVPIDTIIEWVWPEESSPPRSPAPTFHTYAARIRRSLQRVEAPVALIAEDGNYRLDVDRTRIDYYSFRELMARARTALRDGQTRQAVTASAEAVGLWRGRPLNDLSTERAQAWRTHVELDEWLPANTFLLEALLDLGEFSEVLARLNDLQADHAHDISLAKLRMSALHGLSRPSEAIAYYFGVRSRLLKDGDDQAAEHVRRHHESMLADAAKPDLPPLAQPTTRPRQLPHDIADFVGRDDLLRALDAATTKPTREPQGGVVILDGMAGVGKTALAIHWGHLARHRFPDGDFYVNLNGFSDTAAVTQSRVIDDFLIALGHPPDNSLDLRSRELLLSRLLAHSRTLVVLDNARDTAHVKDLIALLPNCLIIVTSRQRLTTLSASTGARRVRVEPMAAGEAGELLSVQLGTGWRVNDDDRAHLVHLCGGLPLVINVLAEHIATSGAIRLSAFAQQLDRRKLIVDIGHDIDGSAIIQTFFSWSYQRLATSEQRLFRLLALHHGPDIGVDVACAFDGRTPADTKKSFGMLVGAHLLERPAAFDRYQFHDLIREFAEYCAEHDESPDSRRAAEQRMVSHYLTTATAAHRILYPGEHTAPAIPIEDTVEPVAFNNAAQAKFWLDQERGNLTAAIHYAAARGHHDHAWRLADTVATFFDRHGYYEDSRSVREVAVASATAVGDDEAAAASQAGLGMVLTILGDHAGARRCLDAALRFAEATGNELGQGTTLHQLGRLAMARGDPAGAVELFLRCLDIAQGINDHQGLCWTHCRIGEAHRLLKQHDQALIHLNQSQFHAQRIGDEAAHAASLAQIGLVHRDRGDYHAAAAYCERALQTVETMPIRDRGITTRICTALAEVNLARGNLPSATEYGSRAATLARRIHNAASEADALVVLGDAQLARGEPHDAVLTWGQAGNVYERLGNTTGLTAIHAKIGGALAAPQLPDAATLDTRPDDAPAT